MTIDSLGAVRMVFIVRQSGHIVESKLLILQQPHVVKRNGDTTLEAPKKENKNRTDDLLNSDTSGD